MSKAPFYRDIARAPKGEVCEYHEASDGVRLRMAAWHNGAKGTVLIFQGRTEFIEKYGPVIQNFMDMGYNVAAVDWRGQGLSQRLNDRPTMGHVDVFEDYQKDVATFMKFVEAQNLPKPYTLVTHSMGGTIGLRALIEGLDVKNAIFSAPMWDIAVSGMARLGIKFYTLYLARFFDENFFVPTTQVRNLSFTQKFRMNTLTSYEPEYKIRYDQLTAHPDLEIGGPSMKWLREALNETRRTNETELPDIPVHAFVGTNERIVSQKAIHKKIENAPNGKLTVLDAAKHELFIEKPEHTERLWADIKEFMS